MRLLPIIFLLIFAAWFYQAHASDVDVCTTPTIARLDIDHRLHEWRRGATAEELGSQTSIALGCLVKTGMARDRVEAVQKLVERAENNVEDAIVLLTTYYLSAYITSGSNLSELMTWANRGVANGIPDAKYTMSRMLLNGEGVVKDIDRGIKMMMEAAESGSIAAQAALAYIYTKGAYGQPEDLQAARAWRRKAIDTTLRCGWSIRENGNGAASEKDRNSTVEDELLNAACADPALAPDVRREYCTDSDTVPK